MEIKFTDMDIVDANISFSKEYLARARAVSDKERLLKLLLLANKSLTNAIQQLDSTIKFKNENSPNKVKVKK